MIFLLWQVLCQKGVFVVQPGVSGAGAAASVSDAHRGLRSRGPREIGISDYNYRLPGVRSLELGPLRFFELKMAETLQQLILDSLDALSIIDDTRSLTIPGQSAPATSEEDQITILGALNSLLSREVRVDLVSLARYFMESLK
ncbi:hypothetical protein H2248_003055 [Termitomyces sp. 'cryptogamus']|nr:hypothetical protein H2248_003055 [Termitomyces sp. 'cryptogamus']